MENGIEQTELQRIAALDPLIHTPARLLVMRLLSQQRRTDFNSIMELSRLTWGNLSTHLSKLEEAGYVMITKTFRGKRPRTLISLTESGLQAYLDWGRAILAALPDNLVPGLRTPLETRYPIPPEEQGLPWQQEYPPLGRRDVFFLPLYHRWGREIPPIREFTPLS